MVQITTSMSTFVACTSIPVITDFFTGPGVCCNWSTVHQRVHTTVVLARYQRHLIVIITHDIKIEIYLAT